MSIITLYGAKGGTGRTTTAAAFARGMSKLGRYVTLVETDDANDPLARWWSVFDQTLLSVGSLDYRSATTPDEIDLTMRYAPPSDRHVTIFDTSHQISAARSYVFELADLVLMPFTGFLDASIGISKASSQLAASKHLMALPIGELEDLSHQVAKWMPLVRPPYPETNA